MGIRTVKCEMFTIMLGAFIKIKAENANIIYEIYFFSDTDIFTIVNHNISAFKYHFSVIYIFLTILSRKKKRIQLV